MKDQNCLYCMRNQTQKDLMIEICDLQVSTLFLFKEQSYHGRVLVAYKDHVNELFDLPVEEQHKFMEDVAHAAATVKKLFGATKMNMGAYADTLAHLHMHIVPKYKDGYGFNGTFEMNPKKTYLSDEEYAEMIAKIKEAL